MKNKTLGDYLKITRLLNRETLGDMAEKVGVSASFLSQVENGKKAMPENLLETIFGIYEVSSNEKMDMIEAAAAERDIIKKSSKATAEQKNVFAALARNMDSLDEEELQQILKIIKGGKK